MLSLASTLCLLIPALWLCYRLITAHIEDRCCAAGDIMAAGASRPSEKLPGRAVIIGASVAGLMAARACAAHYDEVILLDAERCSTDPNVKRTRVKQHSQLHRTLFVRNASLLCFLHTAVFLALLAPSLKSLFPTWASDMHALGGTFCAPRPNSNRGGRFTRLPDTAWPVEQLYISREAFEALLRRLVLALKPVQAQVGTVNRLIPSADRKTIEAIMVRREDGTMDRIDAALVVDASGTTNGSMHWLRKSGYPEPIKQAYDPRIRYTCMTWSLTPETIAKFDAIEGNPHSWSNTGHLGSAFVGNHASSFMRIEGDRVRCLFQTIIDDGRDPADTEEMRNAIHSEPYSPASLAALDVVWSAEQQDGAPSAQHKQVNIGACYKMVYDARNMPSNLVPLGDTILRVNPIFGQGCTKAMIDALTLDRTLRRTDLSSLSTITTRFLDLHYARTEGLWKSTRSHDYGLESTVPVSDETLQWGSNLRSFNNWVLRASHKNASVGAYITESTGQLRSFYATWFPSFLLRCWAVHMGIL